MMIIFRQTKNSKPVVFKWPKGENPHIWSSVKTIRRTDIFGESKVHLLISEGNTLMPWWTGQQDKVPAPQTCQTYLVLELLHRIDSSVAARQEHTMASRITAAQPCALLPITGKIKKTPRLSIINEKWQQSVSPPCLRCFQVRAEDAFPSESPPNCQPSSSGWMKSSTLRVIGWRFARVTKWSAEMEWSVSVIRWMTDPPISRSRARESGWRIHPATSFNL